MNHSKHNHKKDKLSASTEMSMKMQKYFCVEPLKMWTKELNAKTNNPIF